MEPMQFGPLPTIESSGSDVEFGRVKRQRADDKVGLNCSHGKVDAKLVSAIWMRANILLCDKVSCRVEQPDKLEVG